MSMPVGRFITLEGGEGAGKSTQIQRLRQSLECRGIQVVATREPGGTPSAETIRRLLVEGDAGRWRPLTEVLLHYAARNEHVETLIRPALARGTWVLSDRFSDSTRAYQSYGLGVAAELVEAVDGLVLGAFQPDLTLVLDLPVEIGLRRAAARRSGETRYEDMPIELHRRLRAGFIEIAAAHPGRCVVINAEADPETVHVAVWRAVADHFGLDG